MDCKHQYFKYENGALVCSVCGRPASELKKPAIEDKIGERGESKRAKNKRSWR